MFEAASAWEPEQAALGLPERRAHCLERILENGLYTLEMLIAESIIIDLQS